MSEIKKIIIHCGKCGKKISEIKDRPYNAGEDILIIINPCKCSEKQNEHKTENGNVTVFPACEDCEYNPCDMENNLDYCPAPERR